MEDNSYPDVTEVYRSMAISGQNEEIIVYRSAGRTVDQALRQLVSGYRRGES
jgi:hypothetical protein